MKKILTTGLCLALASIGGAEVIQSVNFNPARFGQYERLKVSEQANFKGGLKAKSMQVQSAGTIDLNATPSTDQGNLAYLITKLDGTLGHSHVGNDFPATPTLVFPATCFSSAENCVGSTGVGLLQVAFMNGAARFQAPSSYTAAPESRIKQITTPSDRLRLDAVYANIHGKLDVSGNWGYTFRNISPKTPLRLAGNWIPLPSASGAPTGGTLEWQTRKTVKYASNGGDKGGDKVRVLALKGKKSVSCNKTCHDGKCPGGYTGKITYRLNTTTCSCEVASNTCKPNEKYEWVSVQSGAVPGKQEIMNPAYCRTGRDITDLPQGYNVDCKTTPCSSGNVGKYCSNVETRQISNYQGHALYWACYFHVFRCEKK
ncbi:MAG: hypothetical protein PUK73_01540 [Spirochaetota bacterium]|uniref:hypothetical protein n=1 Tax=Candidatus Avelusimicrobium faecicola TaxID=3416205 RepID=UPI002A61DC05|nr:hypothetical protein [Spirochaetota bacterium]MDY6129577.1 hypothetical protein [Elusimicrobiaceae bacterium]